MSSTVLLSKGAGQIYILAVMAEAAVVDDDVPPLTVAVFRLCTSWAGQEGQELFPLAS